MNRTESTFFTNMFLLQIHHSLRSCLRKSAARDSQQANLPRAGEATQELKIQV